MTGENAMINPITVIDGPKILLNPEELSIAKFYCSKQGEPYGNEKSN